jgi:hypothetical protein
VRRPAVLREGDGGVVGAGPPGGAEEMGSGARPPGGAEVEETGRCCGVASGRAGVEGGEPRPAVSSRGGSSTAPRSEWKTRRWDRAVATHVEEAGPGRGRGHRGGGRAVVGRDGNGAPIPDPRRGIPLLGDVNGRFLLPAGSLADQNSSPSGEAGEGAFSDSPSPIPVGIPEFVCLCI